MYMLRLKRRENKTAAKLFVLITLAAALLLILVACDRAPISYRKGDCIEVDTSRGHGVCRVVDGYEQPFDFIKTRLQVSCRFDVNDFEKTIWVLQPDVKRSNRCKP